MRIYLFKDNFIKDLIRLLCIYYMSEGLYFVSKLIINYLGISSLERLENFPHFFKYLINVQVSNSSIRNSLKKISKKSVGRITFLTLLTLRMANTSPDLFQPIEINFLISLILDVAFCLLHLDQNDSRYSRELSFGLD